MGLRHGYGSGVVFVEASGTFSPSMDQTPILPASCLVAPVMWELDADIEQASRTEPAPLQCPVGRMYVPSTVRDQLIYMSRGVGGTSRTSNSWSRPATTGLRKDTWNKWLIR
ncbi:unnamed protein product [Oncorhynchus mykiss]|uniref:Uncharacterized protein n=1 Tax=Oncorhynchus mykiss TaxID=8022 RepID=A0A060XYS3_ONCMY|nr:unnamed protein product [Oncorhynchus mykiss]